MAQHALVVDASVVVKWFLTEEEYGVPQALSLLEQIAKSEVKAYAPDLVCFEVLNALVFKKNLTYDQLKQANTDLFDIGLNFIPATVGMLANSIGLARQFKITVYDSSYIAMAKSMNCPLVTANPKHQRQALNCQIIPIEKWQI